MQTLDETLRRMKIEGYCLWAGAGVSIHAAAAGSARVPAWRELVDELEQQAGLPNVDVGLSYPERLDLVLHKLGRVRLQQALRSRVHEPLGRSLMDQAHICSCTPDDPIPPAVRQLARLGARANPIVNFNFEALTSRLLGGAEPFAIRSFVPAALGRLDNAGGLGSHSQGDRFNRSIYHPHGVISVSGICVLSTTEYRALNGTLALQLAVHAAFQSMLVVVGMSLQDEYLREQLTRFRDQIREIFWFSTDSPEPEIERWRVANRVTLVRVPDWVEFWRAVGSELPTPPDWRIASNWMGTLHEAASASGHSDEAHALATFRELRLPEAGLAVWKQTMLLRGIRVPEPTEPATNPFPAERSELIRPILQYLGRVWRAAPA